MFILCPILIKVPVVVAFGATKMFLVVYEKTPHDLCFTSLLAFSKSFDVEITKTISKHLKSLLCGMYELREPNVFYNTSHASAFFGDQKQQLSEDGSVKIGRNRCVFKHMCEHRPHTHTNVHLLIASPHTHT